jgi:AcrR family transcriptional regulator
VPKLWNDTIEAHRQDVRAAIEDTTAALATKQGVASVTMSQIAEATGIGRATLYKYFPDVDAILVSWHERQVGAHLHELAAVCHRDGSARERLEAVLVTYASMKHEHHGHALAALVHRGEHLSRAEQHLLELVAGLIAEAARTRELRDDVAPVELASYCLHALNAAAAAPSKPAVRRLVQLTLSALTAQRRRGGRT